MTEMKKQIVCQKCIIHDGFLGININNNGQCDFCNDPTHNNPNYRKVQISDEIRANALKDWNTVVKSMQTNQESRQYDCVLGFSGGKDSTGLLDSLVSELNIRPFLITVDTGFMTDVAKDNIKKTLKKMNLDKNFIIIEEAIPTFTKFYKDLFLNHNSNEKTLTVEVCHACTDIIHTIIVKEAMKRDIPLVLIGFSPDQIGRYFYETSTEDTIEDGLIPEGIKSGATEQDLKWFINPETIEHENIPRIIYPYHVMAYDESEIINRVESKSLIQIGKADSILTNCHVVKVAALFDLHRFGGVTYALQYAELVRQAETDEERRSKRKDWLRTLYSQGAHQMLNGNFNVEGNKQFLDRIGISEEELLGVVKIYREQDPNLPQILKNIELIRNRKLR